MRKTSKLELRTQTVRLLSTNALAGVAGAMPGKRCTGLDSGCAATLTDMCRTQFCAPSEECTGACVSLDTCDQTTVR